MYPEIPESERFPLLTPRGRELLYRMRQHPHAPLWNWPNGEQLDAVGLECVQQFAQRQRAASKVQPPGSDSCEAGRPEWVDALVDYVAETVPFYRKRAQVVGVANWRFEQIPSCSREDLAPRVWDFVPDDQSLDQLIIFSTSGTTGHPARMPSHPATAACGVPLMESVLQQAGIDFPRGPEAVALTNVVAYRGAFTTAIVIAYLEEAGCVRVNLHPDAWRKDGDCPKYLNEWAAPVWLGDPMALAAMENIEVARPPRAILSSILQLTPTQAGRLSRRYGCPVFDLYALTEVGILGVSTQYGHENQIRHEIVPHDVYVEILGEDDRPLPDGVRGEIAVTCRRNPYMPLLRYRTGDFAALSHRQGRIALLDLEGRQPVSFPLPSGRIIHSMEATRMMRHHAVVQYRLHQDENGHFAFGYRGLLDIGQLKSELSELLEQPAALRFEELPAPEGRRIKVRQYSSDFVHMT